MGISSVSVLGLLLHRLVRPRHHSWQQSPHTAVRNSDFGHAKGQANHRGGQSISQDNIHMPTTILCSHPLIGFLHALLREHEIRQVSEMEPRQKDALAKEVIQSFVSTDTLSGMLDCTRHNKSATASSNGRSRKPPSLAVLQKLFRIGQVEHRK